MKKNGSLLFWVCAISLIAAIGTHVYLTDHHYKVKFGALTEGGLCNINETVNCSRTSASQYSEVFGVPISIFGGILNLILLGLLFAFRYPLVNAETQRKLGSPLRLTSLFIFATSLVMGFISFALLNAVCPACTITYGLSLISFATIFMMTSRSPFFQASDIKLYGGMAVAVLALGYFTHLSTQRQYGGKEVLEMVNIQFEDWQARPALSFTPVDPITMHPNPSSPMKIVEFADFLCGHCAAAFPVIHRFVKNHPDVEFSFQAFPLDGECNSSMKGSRGTPCFLARISHCAGKQNKGWEVQEWMFENQSKLFTQEGAESMLSENIESFGINKEELLKCADSEETRNTIREQAKMGNDIGVQGTPSVYINGKKVPPGFSIPLFQKIYKSLLNQSARSSAPEKKKIGANN